MSRMKNATRIGVVICILGLSVSVLYSRPGPKASSPIENCRCSCHEIHQKERVLELSQQYRKRDEQRFLSYLESERMMKRQEEECSLPFKKALEELETELSKH